MMKKYLMIVFAAALVIQACKSTDNSPEETAKKFFEALKSLNLDEASKYATKDSKSMLDLMKMGMPAVDDKDSLTREMKKQKMVYSEPVIKGDTATLAVTVNDADKTDLLLVKEDGQWKVAFDKNTLMKGGLERMEKNGMSEEEIKEAEDAMKMMNTDSFQKVLREGFKEAAEEADSAKKNN